ncbi:MAG: glycosyltransferase [Flammeovirgaceae bacterium]|nr:glycosyltransferase [Flammeovirgaceae bacterium]
MKKILILAYSDLRHDARVARQVDFLSEGNQLTIACFNSPQEWAHEVFHIKRIRPTYFEKAISSIFLLTNQFESAYSVLYDFPKFRSQIKDRTFDLIVANDIESLPLAFKIKGKEKILFDAHEYAPRHFEDKLVWRIFFQRFNKYLCKKYLPQVDKMITVGEGLAKEYAKHYPVDPLVVTNANYLSTNAPSKVDPNKIKLIHHGAANPSRQLEIMIEMMNHLDERFSLDLLLLTPSTANKKPVTI